MKSKIILVIILVAAAVFVANSALVIEKGTEGQYTGVVAFDAHASSGSDWDKIAAEISGNAVDINTLDLADLGVGKAVKFKANVADFSSKANGKRKSMTVVPENYSGNFKFTVQLGSIYSGTAVRDIQSVKAFGDFTNQTEWSQYAKALNTQLDKVIVEPLKIDDSIKGKTVNIIGAATATGSEVTITPVAMTIE